MEKDLYISKYEKAAFEDMKDSSYFDEDIMYHYKNYVEKMIMPDLLGKTVKVTERQFKSINHIVEKIAELLDIEVPPVFVYEDFYYGVEAKGGENPWIEISAKTIMDFSEKEITFLLGREMCGINLKHVYYSTLIDETLSFLEQNNIFAGTDIYANKLKISMYRWKRLTNYSQDCFGYLVCKDLKTSIDAILKLILNNTYLAENVDVLEYVKQAEIINGLDDKVYNFTKMDEKIPYGPFRVKNLIGYSASERGIEAIKKIKDKEIRRKLK